MIRQLRVVMAAAIVLLALLVPLPAAAQSASGTLYLVDVNADALYTVNTATGTATNVGSLGVSTPTGLASLDGTLYLIDNSTDDLYTVNIATGTATSVGDLGVPTNPGALASLDGTLYLTDRTTERLYTVNTATGIATNVGLLGVSDPTGLAGLDGTLYLADNTTDDLHTVNTTTGAATSVGDFGVVSSPQGMAALDGTLYVIDATNLYTVNTTTGTATRVGSLGVNNALGLASFPFDPPSAPQNLEAVADVRTAISLTWDAPATGDNLATPSGYEIERSEDGSSGWAEVADTDASTTRYRDDGLPENTRRYYRVRATSAAEDDSAWSSTADATTLRGSSDVPGDDPTVGPTPVPTPEGLFLEADAEVPGADIPLLGPIAQNSPTELPWRILGPIIGLGIVSVAGIGTFAKTKSAVFAAIIMSGVLAVVVGAGLASVWWLIILPMLWTSAVIAERTLR